MADATTTPDTAVFTVTPEAIARILELRQAEDDPPGLALRVEVTGTINEPDEMAMVVDSLGRATAKVHCASDEDSDQDLVDFQVEAAIARVLDGRRREFTEDVTEFALSYATKARRDHSLFVDAFREGEIGGVTAT